jgi:cyclase
MMNRPRVIPALLIDNGRLVKTIKYRKPVYIGDPINAVKIFNEKCVDELVILDISRSKKHIGPNMELLKRIASEAFMPMAYGGGISSIDQISKILGMGYEKVVLGTNAFADLDFVHSASTYFGSQSIVVSIDTKPNIFGKYLTYIKSGSICTGLDPLVAAKKMVASGAGEILLNAIHREGTMTGYDIPLIRRVAQEIQIPVIASGGACKIRDFKEALVDGKADAVSAGSMFVFFGKQRGVLITFPDEQDLIDEGIYYK